MFPLFLRPPPHTCCCLAGMPATRKVPGERAERARPVRSRFARRAQCACHLKWCGGNMRKATSARAIRMVSGRRYSFFDSGDALEGKKKLPREKKEPGAPCRPRRGGCRISWLSSAATGRLLHSAIPLTQTRQGGKIYVGWRYQLLPDWHLVCGVATCVATFLFVRFGQTHNIQK